MDSDRHDTTSHAPLTEHTVRALNAILDAVEHGSKVRRLVPDYDAVIEGTARHLVIDPQRYTFRTEDDDLRDCYLRVTAGFEYCWPVTDLIAQFGTGELGFE